LKTVEIRKHDTKKRHHIALCYKGYIYGFAKIVDSYPVPRTQLLTPQWEKKHRASKFLKSGSYATKKALWVWELLYVQKLPIPIPYVHPQGAQEWVNIKVVGET